MGLHSAFGGHRVLRAQKPPWQYGSPDHAVTIDGSTLFTFWGPQSHSVITGGVYFPVGYDWSDSSTLYPIIVANHGLGGSGQSMITNTLPALQAAIAAEIIRPCILVMPTTGDTWHIDAVDPAGVQAYTRWLHELCAHFRMHTRNVTGKRGIAIYGFSMGAFGGLRYSLEHPDRFAAMACMTAPFPDPELLWNDQTPFEIAPTLSTQCGADTDVLNVNCARFFAETNSAEVISEGLAVRISSGDADANPAGIDSMNNFDAILTANGIAHTYTIFPALSTHALANYTAADDGDSFAFIEARWAELDAD